MSTLIKDIYSEVFFDRLSIVLSHVVPSFDKVLFTKLVYDDNFLGKEYKERMKHITKVLHQFFPADFAEATGFIEKTITGLRQQSFTDGNIAFMFFPDYIETYGIDDFANSVNAFEFVTQFISCEFAVRPSIIKYQGLMMQQMFQWSLHHDHRVRRLASEGSRPRLPWAMALPELKKNPTAIIPILENLKSDPPESVRRSVANNLNDIAKDNPQVVLELVTKWKGLSKETDAIIKHGSRTLLKQGDADILKLFNLQGDNILLSDFKIVTPTVKIGESVEFSFGVTNNYIAPAIVRLEYGVYYKRQNGQLSKKVFKISERKFEPQESCTIVRKQKFVLITTRKFYAGEHRLSIIVNGQEKGLKTFELTD